MLPIPGASQRMEKTNGFWLKAGSWAEPSGKELKEWPLSLKGLIGDHTGREARLAQGQWSSNLTTYYMPGTVLGMGGG